MIYLILCIIIVGAMAANYGLAVGLVFFITAAFGYLGGRAIEKRNFRDQY